MTGPSLAIYPAKEAARIFAFVRRVVEDAKAKGVVVGLSGGIDSAVVGALCVEALGKNRVFVLLMPSEHTPRRDVEDARALVETWGTRAVSVPISAMTAEITRAAGTRGNKIAKANVQARVRMALLYYHANTLGYLVAGTGDRSEIEIGFYTKFGDGGVDFLPIAHLYKTQVRALGAHLGVPKEIVEKPASPQLWPGHRALDEIPADYDKLDVILHGLFDRKMDAAETATKTGVSRAVIERVLKMHQRTAHKRTMPPSLA